MAASDIQAQLKGLLTRGMEWDDPEHTNPLLDMIVQNERLIWDMLIHLIVGEEIELEIADDLLRWLGTIEHPASQSRRRDLLGRCLLECRFASVRHGALLGLLSLNDPEAIPSIMVAARYEKIPSLQADIKYLLSQLRK